MKLPLLATALLLSACQLLGQGTGIGTSSPNASAILDITSNSKGVLAPRMTTAQRTGITSPAKGLMVYDTTANSLYHYNGVSWSVVGGSGGLTLPYEASVNMNTPAFKITNSGFGPAIQAITTNEFGYALQASTTANYGYSLYAYSRSPNGIGVYASVDSSTAVKGSSTNGIGVHATSTDSIALRAAIIKGANANPVILASHAGNGAALQATSGTGNAVLATTSSSSSGFAALYGTNTGVAGSGVRGEANFVNNVGVYGISTTGIALFGTSSSGYGLSVSGKVKISGGNTSPAAGAVLTSLDASGNAVWQPLPPTLPKVAFRAAGVYSSFQSIPMDAFRKLHFATESYDYGNDFLPTTSASPSAAMSTFVVPVTGVYHFDIGCSLDMADLDDDFDNIWLEVHGNRNGNIFSILRVESQCCNANLGFAYNSYGSTDVRLIAGDIVYVEIRQSNDDNSAATIDNLNSKTFFTGRLVVAD